MIIDGMMHLEVSGAYWDGLIDEIIEHYDAAGIDKGVVLTTWTPSRESNNRTRKACQKYPDYFIPFGHVRPVDDWESELKRITQEFGWTGLKSHENIPLEDGKSYVIGMLSVNGQGRLYGNLFDGEKWGEEDTLLAENMSIVRGTDKRMSAVWDAQAKVIHFSYVDHDSNLWYRTCKSPYRLEDWSEPVKLKPFKVFTNVMSLDTTKTPAHLWLLYGKTLFEHRDPR